MPIRINNALQTGGDTYASPFVGRNDHTAPVRVTLANLTDDEVDADGYLKPCVPLTKAGALVGAAPAFVYGVTKEAIKVAEGNSSAQLTAAGTVTIAVGTIGQVNRDTIEDVLGRSLTADEVAGFDRAGSKLVLI